MYDRALRLTNKFLKLLLEPGIKGIFTSNGLLLGENGALDSKSGLLQLIRIRDNNIASMMIGMGLVASSAADFAASSARKSIFSRVQELVLKQGIKNMNFIAIDEAKIRSRRSASLPIDLGKACRSQPSQMSAPVSKGPAAIMPTEVNVLPNEPFKRSPRVSSISYYEKERRFIDALIGVGIRLAKLPREERSKSLETELSLINYQLPASVCLPLWCASISTSKSETCFDAKTRPTLPSLPSSEASKQEFHHRVLRICPTESTILNSAERVPYLIMVEVLEGPYSDAEFFECTRRAVRRSEMSLRPPTAIASSAPLNRPVYSADHSSSASFSVAGSQSREFSPPASPHSLGHSPSGSIAPLVMDSEEFNGKMRAAAILLTQLHEITTVKKVAPRKERVLSSKFLNNINGIRARIILEMENLERERIMMLAVAAGSRRSTAMPDYPFPMKEDISIRPVSDESAFDMPELKALTLANEQIMLSSAKLLKEDPSALILKEDWASKTNRIKAASPFGSLPGYKLLSVIVKSGTDLRQEQLAVQIISEMKNIWTDCELNESHVFVRPFKILITGNEAGLIETLRDTISIHSIKKEALIMKRSSVLGSLPTGSSSLKDVRSMTAQSGASSAPAAFTLYDYFVEMYGLPNSESFRVAQRNFMASLVGYSLVTYLLALKDRHNGNILLDKEGHLIHIDFGFMLSNSPGYVGFETAPFKLPFEYVQILEGYESDMFQGAFKDLFFKAFVALRKYSDRILTLVEMMQKGRLFVTLYLIEEGYTFCFSNFSFRFEASMFLVWRSGHSAFEGALYDWPNRSTIKGPH